MPSLNEASLRPCAQCIDLVHIWRYLKNNASLEIADRVESAILHGRRDVEDLLKDRL